MSGAGSYGSGYGLGYYGKGPYGFATRIMGIRAGTRGTLRPQIIAQAQLNMVSAPLVVFAAEQLWSQIDVPPCEPWETIGSPSCSQAVPNSMGNMFPGLKS